MWIVWDHKRFFVDLINEWSSDSTADLCSFVPYTVYVNLKVLDKFEVILLLNDKNWIDTSSSAGAENLLAAIVGTQLGATFALPFTDFAPTITPFDFEMNASDNLALRVKVPPQFATEPIFTALQNSAHYRNFMEKSSIAVGLSDEWVELYRTEIIALKCNFLFHPIPTKVVSDLPEKATNQWLPKLAQHPAHLEPDKLKLVVDIGASEVFVSGLVVKMILDLKDNYFGYYDQISDIASKPLHSARTKVQQQLSPEYYRPMSAELVVKIQNIRGHCLLHAQKMNSNISDICPILFTEQISVELKKHHGECLVQALLGPTIIYFPPSLTFPGVNDGFVTLSAFQFRGHGLYSDVDVPWEVEIVEYGWLMELILGDLTSKVHPGQLIEVMQFLDSTILLILNSDEKLEVPDRLDLCQHFENIRICRKSDLHITDVQGRKQNCESSETLKYKLVRVSVDSCNLLIVEEKAAIKINTNKVHVCFCNAHAGSFCENVIIQIPLLKCKQLLHVPERKLWLECGFAKIHEVSLDFRLPCPEAQLYVLEERKIFLTKHDKPQPRLYFLWEKGTKNCGCVGSTRFFAEKDKTGHQFIVTATSDLAIPKIVTSPLEQPGFFQSIIYPNSYVKSATSSPTTSAYDYAAFLENYELIFSIAGMPQLNEQDDVSRWIAKNRIKVKKISDGITDIQMIKKEAQASAVSTPVGGPQGAGQLLQKASATKKNNDFESITSDADWGKDFTAIYVRGKASDKVN
uniref:Bridge-like lipid transfer protein family member 1 N-terminal domain-containing protein n=1 Tax=Panagrolaimus sp. ES5 TaxID=591445 RepID=A0AC34G0T0_9BILA